MAAIIPHFKIPFEIGSDGSAVCLEQGSLEEITQCVTVILTSTVGEFIDLPEFGVPDLVLRRDFARTQVLAAIQRWEPRATVVLSANPDMLDELIENVIATVGA